MIQVMIVEDEAPIQRSLRVVVESAHDMFEVAAMAYNGLEALELLDRIKPDLIITDIRMPVMNGLELAGHVRDRYPDTEILLLSGYQDFEYARQAMQLGVKHYLLKPVSRSQVRTLLEAIYSEIQARKKNAFTQYIASLINGEPHLILPPERQELYASHLLMLCCAGPVPLISFNEQIPGKTYWDNRDPERMVPEELKGIGDLSVVGGKTVAERWVMISIYKNHSGLLPPGTWAELLANRLGNDLPVSIVYSRYFSDIRQTAHWAQIIRSMMIKNIPFGAPIRLSIQDDLLPDDGRMISEAFMARLVNLAVGQQNRDLFKSEVVHLIGTWGRAPAKQVTVENELNRLLSSLIKQLGPDLPYTQDLLELEIHKIIVYALDYDQVSLQVSQLIDYLFSLQGPIQSEKEGNEILADNLEKYLQEHMTEDIDHKKLSDRFGLVPSYLSKVFAKYKGVSPAKYIVQIRVHKAKELLCQDSNLLTKDIAQIVGYSDSSHFSRIFKRETGMYPTEYRKKYAPWSRNR
ncbi:response regulator [Cohnella sp. CFH 77786]|uniref:response regulator n=1 Tax=Cohnella sp. CFH 77786 TaxID=2662265 RepID=UPI001C60E0EF|nr:response regulator [Cohnella sp. CFH 77786]MBW5449314.1 response regulator [Cohnella sp. CFH 77786]